MTAAPPPLTRAPREQMFPALTPEQPSRLAARGRVRSVVTGDVLMEVGDSALPFFAVRTGGIAVVRPAGPVETPVAVLGPGEFTGEMSMLSGRRALVRIRVTHPGELIELDRPRLLALVHTDSELGEIVLRAFILRRLELIAQGIGDVVLVGSMHSPGTLRIKEFLTQNGHPYSYLDLDRDAEVQGLLDGFGVGIDEVPVVICRSEVVLRNPTNAQIADCLGFNMAIDATQLRDVVVVGPGPPDSRRRCTPPRKGSTSWSSRPTPLGVRPARARKSRITSASRPGSAARTWRRGPSTRPRNSEPKS